MVLTENASNPFAPMVPRHSELVWDASPLPEPMKASGVILAGGASRRMGRDKAHLPWRNVTLVQHIVETLRACTDELILVVKDRRMFEGLRVRVVEDLVPDAHALGGLYTGLKVSAHERCFVCTCDAPFLNTKLIKALIRQVDGWDMVIPRTHEGLQPLHAVYKKSVLPAIEEQLHMRQWSLHAVVPKVRAHVIEPEQIERFDPGSRSFVNINTPEDYERARGLSGQYDTADAMRQVMADD